MNMPSTPTMSIGSRQYPSILIIVYSEIGYFLDMRLNSKKLIRLPTTNNAQISPKCILPESINSSPNMNAISNGPNKSVSYTQRCRGFQNFMIEIILSATSQGSTPMSYNNGGYQYITVPTDAYVYFEFMKIVYSVS